MPAEAASYPPEVGPVFSLSIHADYRCQHSGVCCTSDWDVPAELHVYRGVGDALAAGRVVAPGATSGEPIFYQDDLPDDAAAMVARAPNGHCVFYHGGSGLCVIHRDLGEAMLPLTCR